MGLESDELRNKKTELENELSSLSRREEILAEINEILEERLEAKSEEKIELRREVLDEFAGAQFRLEKQQNEMAAKEKSGPPEIGLRLGNRVRLNGNAVFSWSYQKLPKSRFNQRGISWTQATEREES